MRIKFNQDVQLKIVEAIENDTPIESQETFKAGEIVEIDLVDHPEKFNGAEFVEDKNLWNVQFGNGSMAMCVSREWFDIFSNED